ncbi:hypothetical protein KP509_31G067000 [Ceratopteris richardii]|uniref:Uncharacterized protein n=1 Tax=Ceratopteris richardii TaxID=49495 RepID=A0A8T2QYQ7_CERRI|nr:hypothetical protein KP509_31G067000 [Ceratopteris richardii]
MACAFLQLACSNNGQMHWGAPSTSSSVRQSHGLLNVKQERAILLPSPSPSPERRLFAAVNAFNGILLSFLLFGDLEECCIARADIFGNSSSEVEQIEPTKGDCATCLGVVDETLGTCGGAQNCVSTFDDRPAFFIAPWEFPGKLTAAFENVKLVLIQEGGDIVEQSDRYMHVIFTDDDGTIDDLELLFSDPSEDAIVNIRSASRKVSQGDNGRNKKRLEKVRGTLMWEEVPILRNRNRKLFFLESPWDTFGPEPPPVFDYSEKLDFIPD